MIAFNIIPQVNIMFFSKAVAHRARVRFFKEVIEGIDVTVTVQVSSEFIVLEPEHPVV
jgi:hypothetical protein